MEIQQEMHGAVTVLRPTGALTGESIAALREELDEVRQRSLGRLVLDTANVPYIDSAALELLLEVSEAMAGSGQALKLVGANDVLREVLDLTDLASCFEQFEDVNAAVRSFI
jgi:anti-sigma B factor antagonist